MGFYTKALIAVILLTLFGASQVVQADGMFLEGQINSNLDTNTDYLRFNKGEWIPIEGIATLSLGYKVNINNSVAISAGISHYSNPYTSYDYGGNGLFIKGCVGNGC